MKPKLFIQFLLFVAAVFAAVSSSAATGLTYHGRILLPGGSPLEGANVFFHIQVRSPGVENCLLFDEQQTLNMTGSKGLFVLTIGDGTRAAPAVDGGNPIDRIFANRGTISGAPTLTCNIGNSYAPGIADGRKLQVQFNDGSGWQALPAQNINYVPLAIESTQISGYKKDQLLRVADGVTATEFSGANWTALWDLITGNSLLYQKADGSNFSPTADVDFNGQQIVDLADPTSAQDAATKNYVDTSLGGRILNPAGVSNVAGNGRTLIWDQAQNKWVTGILNDTSKLALSGGTMTGPINMGSYSFTNVGHVVIADQGTMYLGKFDAGQESALLLTPLNNGSDRGRTWFNVDTGKMRYWDGTAAQDVATKDYVDSAVAAGVAASGDLKADGSIAMSADWDVDGAGIGTRKFTGFAAPTASDGVATKGYADSNWLGLPVAAPGAGEVLKSVRWNAAGTAWEYYTPFTAADLTAGNINTALGYTPQASLGFTPVNRAGDTMTGLLLLSADPSNAVGAATKQYVDAVSSAAAGAYVRIDGTTALTADWDLNGLTVGGTRFVTGVATPVVADGAANKAYVDAREAAAIAAANAYTDAEVATALATANTYTDTEVATAVADGEAYADASSAAAQAAAIAAAQVYSDGKLVTKDLAIPLAAQDGQSIRWNNTSGDWEYFTASVSTGTVSTVTSANGDATITNNSTTPEITINTGTGNNQIVKLNGSAELPAVSGVNLTNLNASNLASGALPDARLSTNVALKTYVDAGDAAERTYADGKLVSKDLAVPLVGQDGQSIRWNNTTDDWEYFTINSGDGSAFTNLDADNISSGTLNDARLSANVALKSYVDAADLKLITKNLAQPLAGDDMKVIRWNQTAGQFEYAIVNAGDGSALTNLDADNIASGTLNDARLSTNVALKSYVDTAEADAVTAANAYSDGKLVSKDLAIPVAGQDGQSIRYNNTSGDWEYFTINSGDGSALTNLNASNLASGTVPDARLSTNVALKTYVDAGDAAERTYVDGKLVTKDLAVPAAGQDGQSIRWNNTSQDWEYFTASVSSGTVSSVTSANTDASFANTTTTPVLTLNTGTGANQLVKLNGSSELPAVSGVNLTALNASNVASGTLADARLSNNVALKSYVDAGDAAERTYVDGKLVTKDLAIPLAGQDGQSIRYNNTSGDWEYFAINSGDGSALTNLNASNISSGTLADARLSANVALKAYTDANILGLPLAAPAGAQVGQAIRWNAGGTAWEYFTPGTGNGSVTNVSSANADIGVATGGTTPVLTLNVGTGNNQILKLNGSAELPAVSGVNLTALNASNIASGTLADARLSANVALKTYVDAGDAAERTYVDGKLVTKDLAIPLAGQDGQSIRYNNTSGDWEYFTINSGDGSALTNLNASNIASGTLADARLSANVALKTYVDTAEADAVTAANAYSDSKLVTKDLAIPAAGQDGQSIRWNNTSQDWEYFTAGSGSGTVSTVTSANTDASITNNTTTPQITINTGVGNNQILKLNGSAQIPAVDGSLLTNLSAANLAGTINDARLSTNVALKSYVDTAETDAVAAAQVYADGKLVSKDLAIPVAGQDGQSIRYNNTSGDWEYFTPGTGNGSVTSVSSANTDIGVATGGTTPVLTLNVGTGNNQIVKLNGSAELPAVSGVNLTALNASNIASGTLADARLSANVALKTYVDAGDLKLITKDLAQPLAGDDLKAIRWNQTSGQFEYFTPSTGSVTGVTSANADIGVGGTAAAPVLTLNAGTGNNQIVKLDGSSRLPAVDGSLLTNLSAANLAGTINDARLSANVALKSYVDTAETDAVAAAQVYADGKLVSKDLVVPAAGQDGQSIRWNNTSGDWEYFTAGSGSGTVSTVTSANTDASITNNTTTPQITINTGTGNNQILKLNGSAQIPAVDGSLLTNLSAANLAGTINDARLSANVALKSYVDAGDLKLVTKDLAVPAVGQNGQSIRWNNAIDDWEYFTPATGTGDFLANGTVPMTGSFKAADGTAAAPSITFNSDQNTGIYSNAADTIGFATNGALAFRILGASNGYISNGKMRGDTGSASQPTFGFENDTAAGMYRAAANTVGISTDSTERMRIDASGNVGIGDTSPDALLDVAGTLGLSGATSGIVTFAAPATVTSGTYVWPAATPASNMVLQSDNTGALSWVANGSAIGDDTLDFAKFIDAMTLDASTSITAPSGQAYALSVVNEGSGNSLFVGDQNADASPFVIDASGNVGVGTATPSGKFQVIGNAAINGTLTVQASGLINVVQSNASVYTPTGATSFPVSGLTAGYTAYNNNPVDGNTSFIRMTGRNTASVTQDAYIGIASTTGAGVYSPSIVFGQQTAASAYAERMRIDSDGNLGIGDTSPDALLDVAGTLGLSGSTSGIVTFAAPATVTSGAYVWPAAMPASNMVLQSDNAGALSWVANGSAVGDDTLDFAKFIDAMTLDATTSITAPSGQSYALNIVNEGSGNSLFVGDEAADASPFVINTNGSVGVGTASPQRKFVVADASPIVGLKRSGSAVDDGLGWAMWGSTSLNNDLTFSEYTTTDWTGASARVTFQKGGNVGIGTTAPTSILHVNTSGANALQFTNTATGAASNGDGTLIGLDASTNLAIWNNESGDIYMATTGTERFRIKAGGNVGIGADTTPDAKLDVEGTLGLSGSGSGVVTFAAPATVTSGTYVWPAATPASNMVLQSDNTGALSWVANGSSIGDDTLDFSKFIDAMTLDATTSITAPSGQAYALSVNNEGTGASFRVNDSASDTTPFIIDADGNVSIGSTTNTLAGLDVRTSPGASWGGFFAPSTSSNGVAIGGTASGGAINAYSAGGGDVPLMLQANGVSNVAIGTASPPLSRLDVSGNLAVGTYAGSVAAPANGMIVSGNVGIGTSTVNAKLDVKGTLGLSGSTSGTLTIAAPATVTSGTYVWPAATPASNMVLQSSNTGALSWVASSSGTVTNVSSANADIGVATGGTTPVLTLNSGVGANQILKLNGTSQIPAVDGSLLTSLNGTNIASGTVADARLSSNVALKNLNLSQFSVTSTSAQLLAHLSDETGTGASVFAASPALTTPTISGLTSMTTVDNADTVLDLLSLQRTRGGGPDPAAGSGAGLIYSLEGFSNSTVTSGRIASVWETAQANATTARDAKLSFQTILDNSLTEKMSLSSTGNLVVNGSVEVGPDTSACAAGNTGAIRLNGTALEYCNGTAWGALGGGGGGALHQITAATTTNTIDNLLNAQTWNWSTATTQTPLRINANAITTGSILSLASSSAVNTGTNGLLYVGNTSAATTGTVARIQANSTAGSGLTVLADGNVGIGTANPAVRLQIDSTGLVPLVVRSSAVGRSTIQIRASDGNQTEVGYSNNAAAYWSSGNTGSQALLGTGATAPLTIGTNGVQRILVESGGNVAIGKTSAGAKLDVMGTLGLSGSTSGTLTFAAPATVTSGTYVWPAATPASNMVLQSSNTGVLSWVAQGGGGITGTLTSGRIPYATGASAVADSANFVWDNTNARLGIGTNSPITKVHVESAGDVSQRINSTGSGAAAIELTNATAGSVFLGRENSTGSFFGASANAAVIGLQAANPLQFMTGGTVRMTFDSSGNLGIGMASAGEKLEVAGNVKATSFISTSDARLKRDVATVSGLDAILLLRGVSWIWKADGVEDSGVIAQEVEKVLPAAVVTSKDGMKAVKYNAIIAQIIEATKDVFAMYQSQQIVIAEQGRKIASVEADVNSLKHDQENLKEKVQQLESENQMLKSYLCSKDPAAPFCK